MLLELKSESYHRLAKELHTTIWPNTHLKRKQNFLPNLISNVFYYTENPQRLFALVLTPTRELAFQISEQFEALGASIGVKCGKELFW